MLRQSLLKSNISSLQSQLRNRLYKNQSIANHIFFDESFGDSKKQEKEDDYENENDKPNQIIPIPAKPITNQYHIDKSPVSNNDSRIEYVFHCLNITNFNEILQVHQMNFNDLLFLSREDLNEIGLSMVHRNRLRKFCEVYQQFAIDYSYEELMLFFKKNKNFVFKDEEMKHYIERNNKANNNKVNNMNTNNNYDRNKCILNDNKNNDDLPSSKDLLKYFQLNKKEKLFGNKYNNEVFIPNHSPMSIKVSSDIKNKHYIENESPSIMKIGNNNKCHNPSKSIKIEHTELQFSRSANNKTPINRKKNNTHLHIISTYHKINKEIDVYLTNVSFNKEIMKNNSDKKCRYALSKGSQYQSCNRRIINSEFQSDYYSNVKQLKQKLAIPSGNSNIRTYCSNKNYKTTPKYKKKVVVEQSNNQLSEYSSHKLNRNRSLTDLHKGNNDNSLNSFEKLIECIKRKECLRWDLNERNKKINENRKVSLCN